MSKRCEHCKVLNISGVACHLAGCPLAWQDELRECKECGGLFRPEERAQAFCSGACSDSGADELPGENSYHSDVQGGL